MRIRLLLLNLLLVPAVQAQGVMQPLAIQGIQQQDPAAVRTRALGGAFTASGGASPEALLLNPAGLSEMSRPALAVAGLWQSRKWAETQHWNPNRYYAGISLYFSDPETYQSDALSSPDWTHAQDALYPAFAGGVLPFSVGGRNGAVGVAWHLVADLSDYDRNDNVLDPYIGQFRPVPVDRPNPGEEIDVAWSSFERQREGAIRALSPVVAMQLLPDVHVGLRLSWWNGSSDDIQRQRSRGQFLLREDAHDYSFAAANGSIEWNGSSEYSGWTAAGGLRWSKEVMGLGVVYQLPVRLTRSIRYEGVLIDRNGQASSHTVQEEEEITLPFQFTAGASFRPATTLMLTLDYFIHHYEAMEVQTPAGSGLLRQETSASAGTLTDTRLDWEPARGVRLGLEWELRAQWFVRAGFRQDPQPFQIEGFGLLGQTARGNAFSGGLGFPAGPVALDLTYDLQRLLYQDRWESNVDYNRIRKHNLLFGATYRF